jgi:hypothetical protein
VNYDFTEIVGERLARPASAVHAALRKYFRGGNISRRSSSWPQRRRTSSLRFTQLVSLRPRKCRATRDYTYHRVTVHRTLSYSGGFMNSCRVPLPWEFLLSASRNGLQSYELSKLSHASNLRKEVAALIDGTPRTRNAVLGLCGPCHAAGHCSCVR